MTDDEARQICPGTSAWRRLSEEDAAHVVRVHGATSVPRPDPRQSVPPGQSSPDMDEAPWYYDRDRRYLVTPEED
jgi:hypothetical protein